MHESSQTRDTNTMMTGGKTMNGNNTDGGPNEYYEVRYGDLTTSGLPYCSCSHYHTTLEDANKCEVRHWHAGRCPFHLGIYFHKGPKRYRVDQSEEARIQGQMLQELPT
jgi:hypothetical protein